MYRFETIDTVIGSEKIRIVTLNAGEKTAGWVVRRACNAYLSYKPSQRRPDDGVVNLLTDGVLIGQFSNDYDAERALLDEFGITEVVTHMEPGKILYFNLPRDTFATH